MSELLGKPLEDEAIKHKGLYYGISGAGKTYLMGTSFQKYRGLLLLTEDDVAKTTLRRAAQNSGVSLDELRYIEIESKDHIEEVIDQLLVLADKGDLQELVDHVMLDSLTDLQRVLRLDILQQAPKYYKGREMRNPDVLEQGEWGWLQNATEKVIFALRDLPVHVTMTAQVQTRRGDIYEDPAVAPRKFGLTVGGHFNTVAYLTTRELDDETHRVLVTEPTADVQITKNCGILPPVIMNPNLAEIILAVEEGEWNG